MMVFRNAKTLNGTVQKNLRQWIKNFIEMCMCHQPLSRNLDTKKKSEETGYLRSHKAYFFHDHANATI